MNPFKRLNYEAFRSAIRLLRLVPFPKNANAGDRLVIFKLDHIGDFILATGAIAAITKWARSAGFKRITLVTSTQSETIARVEFPECEVVAIPYAFDGFRGGFRECLTAAHQQFGPLIGSQVVCLRHQRTLIQDLLLTWLRPLRSYGLVDCPFGVPPGFEDIHSFRPTDPAQFPDQPKVGIPLELSAHAAVVALVAGQSVSPHDIMPRLGSFQTAESGGILVFPCANDPIREYPLHDLAEILLAIGTSLDEPITIVGGRSDLPTLNTLAGLVSHALPQRVTIETPPSILEATQMIASARLVVGMESGPAHIATAFDKRGIFFLGGGHYGLFAPWQRSSRQIWLRNILPCFGCEWRCCFSEPLCITKIRPEHAIAAIREALLDSQQEIPK